MPESRSHCEITGEIGFDYGASGRGGWDESPAGVEQLRKRAQKKRITRNAGFYFARAEVQGRRPAEVMKMPTNFKLRKNDDPASGGVYLIFNVKSRDSYVGCSRCLPDRWKTHISLMRKRKHPKKGFNRIAKRFGLESFRFMMLQSGLCEIVYGARLDAERRWIKRIKPTINFGK